MITREILTAWDQSIREGKGGTVVDAILDLKVSEIRSPLRPAVAAIARRLGLFKFGLEVLRDDYLEMREQAPAAENEALMTEYAALLTEIGASQISERILSRYENASIPFTYFYRGLLWLKKWEHTKAYDDLHKFIATAKDPYWTSIGELNLLGALVFLRKWDEAEALLKVLEGKAASLTPMAEGLLAELKGQYLFFSGKEEEAHRLFKQSFETLRDTHNPSLMLAEKWLVINEMKNQTWPDVEERFRTFYARAKIHGLWEITRELDRFYAMKQNDQAILAKLYFGSPSDGYKMMICRDLNWTPPQEFTCSLDGEASEPGQSYFDMRTLEFVVNGKKLQRVPKMILVLLRALAGDLYRPKAVGSLFEQIYHGEFYDPSFAGQRIHQIIRRFRLLAEEHSIPLKIVSTDLGFSLVADGKFAIRYYAELAAQTQRPMDADSHTATQMQRIRDTFGTEPFTAADLAAAENLSKRTANRLLLKQVEAGLIERVGNSSATNYRIRQAA